MSIPRTEAPRVLVVDDEPSVVDVARTVLEEAGMIVHGSDSGEAALDMLSGIEIDVVLTDICMDRMDGFELASRVREHDRTLRVIAMTGHDSYDMLRTALDAGMHGYLQKPILDHEALILQVRRACDATRMERTNVSLVKRLRGSLGRIASMNEVLEERNLELARIAITDPLTGLYNRAHIDVVAREALTSANQDQLPLSLLHIELDNFRSVNDRFGHAIGDETLQRCAGQLRSTLERLAPDSATLGRLGGTEFLVVLRNADVTLSRSFGEWLRQAVGTLTVGGTIDTIRVTASIGASSFLPDGRPADQDADALLHRLFREADRALNTATESGCDRVQHHAEADPRATDAPPVEPGHKDDAAINGTRHAA